MEEEIRQSGLPGDLGKLKRITKGKNDHVVIKVSKLIQTAVQKTHGSRLA